MNALISKAERQLANARNELSNVRRIIETTNDEQGNNNKKDSTLISKTNFGSMFNEISASLATAQLTLRSMEEGMSRESNMDTRQAAKQKLKAFRQQHDELKTMLEELKGKVRMEERNANRTALFARDPTISSDRPSSSNQLTEELLKQKEAQVLDHSSNRIEEYITIGTGTLEMLRSQRGVLKGTQKRLMDVGTRLGISQSIMKAINRRDLEGRMIFYAGVIVVFIVLYLCWKYL